MSQQPDKLFRQKLQNHYLQAPPAAWDKIEARLNKRRGKWIWAAAAALLLITVASVLLRNLHEPSSLTASQTKNPSPAETQSTDGNKREEAPAANELPTEKRLAETKKTTHQPSSKRKPETAKITSDLRPEEDAKITPAQATFESTVILPEIEIEEPSIAVSDEESNNVDKTVKVVMEADEVNKKYLADDVIVQATDDKRKPSKLQKLLNKAYDLKTNQDPFGELRQMKNEVLALNLKKEKRD